MLTRSLKAQSSEGMQGKAGLLTSWRIRKGGADRKWGWAVKSQGPPPPVLPQFSRTAPPAEDQVFTHESLWGSISQSALTLLDILWVKPALDPKIH